MQNASLLTSLLKIINKYKMWCFKLCFLYLRNVRGQTCNHLHIDRIYNELELNQRTKAKNGIKKFQPKTLAVPTSKNESW